MPAAKPPALAAALLLAALGWAARPLPAGAALLAGEPPAAASGCPQVLFDRLPDERTRLLFLSWERLPQGAAVYAFAAPRRIGAAAPWQRIREDADNPGPHYLIDLPSGWLYVVAAAGPAPGLADKRIRLRLAGPPEDDAKGAGWDDGEAPALLEADALAGLPAGARVCSGRW